MVIKANSMAEDLVGSPAYRKLLAELVDVAGIEVEPEYAEVFARLDAAKISKAKLNTDELMCLLKSKVGLIKKYSLAKFEFFSDEEDEEEYPIDAEPTSDEKARTLRIGKYSQGFLLANLIEFSLAMSGRECLLEYIKLCKIPNAKKYTDEIMKLTGLC